MSSRCSGFGPIRQMHKCLLDHSARWTNSGRLTSMFVVLRQGCRPIETESDARPVDVRFLTHDWEMSVA